MEQTIQELRDELDQALADLEHASTQQEFNQALVDILDELRTRTEPAPASAPQVNVTLQPSEVKFLPAPGDDFEVTHDYDKSGRLVSSHVRRVKKGEPK